MLGNHRHIICKKTDKGFEGITSQRRQLSILFIILRKIFLLFQTILMLRVWKYWGIHKIPLNSVEYIGLQGVFRDPRAPYYPKISHQNMIIKRDGYSFKFGFQIKKDVKYCLQCVILLVLTDYSLSLHFQFVIQSISKTLLLNKYASVYSFYCNF